jgi:hypothetical protein
MSFHQHQLAMAVDRAIDGRDNGYLDVQQVHYHPLGLGEKYVPLSRGRPRGWGKVPVVGADRRTGEDLARTGKDDHLIVPVSGDVSERRPEQLVRTHAPLEWSSIGMEPHREDPVLAGHLQAFVTGSVVHELGHGGSLARQSQRALRPNPASVSVGAPAGGRPNLNALAATSGH